MMLSLIYLFLTLCQQLSANLQIYLVPHSHQDVGWQHTYSNYFNATDQDISVRTILNEVVEQLTFDKSKKFVLSELKYIKLWMEQAKPSQIQDIKNLLSNKQIELVNGGLVSNDEACPYFEDIIQNYIYGHRYIKDSFGLQYIPKVAWPIDNFGHSLTQSYIFNQLNYTSTVYARMDYFEKQQRKQNHSLIFEQLLPNNQSLLNYVLSDHYSFPQQAVFNFKNEKYSKNLNKTQINKISEQFSKYIRDNAKNYNNNHVMILLGDDFQYQYASLNFKFWDTIINHINEQSRSFGMQISYSTASEYFEILKNNSMSFSQSKNDQFPYSQRKNAYWGGYFTSKPSLKLLIRETGKFLQMARNMISNLFYFKKIDQKIFEFCNQHLLDLSEHLSITIHHDGITGTNTKKVYWNYIEILTQRISIVQQDLIDLFQNNILKERKLNQPQFFSWNQTFSDFQPIINSLKNETNINIDVYNPGPAGVYTLSIKVPKKSYIIEYQGKKIYPDIICPQMQNPQDCDLYFTVKLDHMKFKSFTIKTQSQQILTKAQKWKQQSYRLSKDVFLKMKFKNQKLQIQIKTKQKNIVFSLSYLIYSQTKNDKKDLINSGPYIFHPKDDSPQLYSFENIKQVRKRIYRGSHITVITIEDKKVLTQIKLRTSSNAKFYMVPEIETFIKGLDDKFGQEVILRVETNIDNQGIFYTDSNGLFLMQRKRIEPRVNLFDKAEQISQNYYPVSTVIGIKDSQTQQRTISSQFKSDDQKILIINQKNFKFQTQQNKQNSLYVLNDRCQGGSSLKDGQIELMLHRRLFKDDNLGVGEFLDEKDLNNLPIKVKTRHYLIFDEIDSARNAQILNDNQPVIIISECKEFCSNQENIDLPDFVYPQNENLKVQLETYDGKFLIRMTNLNDKEAIIIDTQKYNLNITSLTGIDYNQTKDNNEQKKDAQKPKTFKIQPLQIQTFIIDQK